MKKCVECRTPIEETVPLNVCCGGEGKASKVGPNADEKYETILEGVNNSGHGVAMNNTTPPESLQNKLTPTNMSPNNNTTAATGNANVSLNHIQKLQQQLRDIREQVNIIKILKYDIRMRSSDYLSIFYSYFYYCHVTYLLVFSNISSI